MRRGRTMITAEERWKLKQLYVACKHESMLKAKISCSYKQYIIAKQILASDDEEKWFQSLSDLDIKGALALREYTISSEKGEILLRLAAQEIESVLTKNLRAGVFLFRYLIRVDNMPTDITVIFNDAKELFKKDFLLRQNAVMKTYSLLIDEIKSSSLKTWEAIEQTLLNLNKTRDRIFLNKVEEKFSLRAIRDFLKVYESLNELLSAFKLMVFTDNKTLVFDTVMEELSVIVGKKAVTEPSKVRPESPFFFRRRGAVSSTSFVEEQQTIFNP